MMIMFVQIMMNQQNQLNQVSPQKLLKQAQRTRGYLLKKSRGFFSNWQKRYFIILNQSLMYYSDEALDQRKGVIEFKDILNISEADQVQFKVEIKSRSYEFKCDNSENRNLWVGSLRLLKNHNLIIKSINQEPTDKKEKTRNKRKLELDKNCLQMLHKVLQLMHLSELKQKVSRPLYYNRIFCSPYQNGYLIIISVKSLQTQQIDDIILQNKYIQPYFFNRMYSVGEKQIKQIGKMSQMLHCRKVKQFLTIQFPQQNIIQIPTKKEVQAIQMTKILKRAYDVGKEYYNPHKIKLKRNVDMLIYHYDTNLKSFQKYVEDKIIIYFRQYLLNKHHLCHQFLQDLEKLKKYLSETDEAFKVKIPFREEVKNYFIKVCHQIIHKGISQGWENIFSYISFRQVLLFSYWIYDYWLIINQIIPDNNLLEGVSDLTRIYLKKMGEKIKLQIQSIKVQKVQIKKTKTELIQNQITSSFLEWLKEIKTQLSESVPVEAVFNEYAKFFVKIFVQLSDYLNGVSEKWTQNTLLVGACNDLSRIQNYFQKEITEELCKGFISPIKFTKTCGQKVSLQLNILMNSLIRKIFIISFSSIDRKILSKGFLELNIGKICFQVLQRIEPFKKKVSEFIENKIIMLSFDEICFFMYTSFVKDIKIERESPQLRQVYINALSKAVTEIQQYYSNSKTQEKVKHHLKQLLLLKDILTCSVFRIIGYCKQLKAVFGSSFNEECLKNLINLRQLSGGQREKVLLECLEELKNLSSDGDRTQSISIDNLNNTRSRKSTLTVSLYEQYTIQLVKYSEKKTKQGYLKKRVTEKNAQTHYKQAYFKISNANLYQYANQKSNKIIDIIPLNKLDKCVLDSEKQDIINMDVLGQSYRFKADNRDQAGKWVQAIYTQLGHPLFQKKGTSSSPKKQQRQILFKDLQSEPPTTSTLKYKNKKEDSEERGKYKSVMKGKPKKSVGIKKQKTIEKTIQLNKKQRPGERNNREDQGSCCSGKFF